MKGSMLSTNGRILAAALLALAVLFPLTVCPRRLSSRSPQTPRKRNHSLHPLQMRSNQPSAKSGRQKCRFWYTTTSQSISEDGSTALRRLTVTAEVFAQQMQYLQDNGYHVITFSDLADYFETGKRITDFAGNHLI